MKKKYDAIIVGSGIAGQSVALALAAKKKSVLILEKPNQKGQATVAAAGILDPLIEFERKSPILKITIPAFHHYAAFLRKLKRLTGKDPGYKKTGVLFVVTNSSEQKELHTKFKWHKKQSIPVRMCSAKVALKKVPALTSKVKSALFYPTIGRIQPQKILDLMRRALKSLGVDFKAVQKTEKLILVRASSGAVCGVLLGKTFISSDCVVDATGAWHKSSWQHSLRYPIGPSRGQILVLQGRSISDTILHSASGMYSVPWRRGQCLIGSTVEEAGFKPVLTKAGIRKIRGDIERIFPDTKKMKVAQSWAGLRPRSKDDLPLIGKSSTEGLYVAGGYFRSGILIGPYAGKLLAEYILSGKKPAPLRAFDPQRFD